MAWLGSHYFPGGDSERSLCGHHRFFATAYAFTAPRCEACHDINQSKSVPPGSPWTRAAWAQLRSVVR